jgi:GNAT superfamily N-acetyltransferase
MVQIKRGREHTIAGFFEDAGDTAILSYLEGHMGKGWADEAVHPLCARIIVGDFCFLGGDCRADGAAELVETAARDAAGPIVICVPSNDGWGELIQERIERPVRLERYAMNKRPSFDRDLLEGFVESVPREYEMRRIGQGLYELALEDSLTKDYVANFESAEDFVRHGLGYCIMHDDVIISGASSYSVYDRGIEIEISTRPEYRRQGLAAAVGARLILACLDRGLHPNWDAANKESVALAEKLGYTFDHAYPAYLLSK